MDRRTMLRALAAAPAAALTWTDAEAAQAHHDAAAAQKAAQKTGTRFTPKFFTAHEWATVGALANMIIPKDARSGSATDAGVPEFMDFICLDQPPRQLAMRSGLAWIDHECQARFDKRFITCTEPERSAVLDDISWPRRARPEMAAGVAFFASFRDLTASGFFTSKMGIDDLGYIGNVYVVKWDGCPPEALAKLGLTTTDD
jgi:gluconate 2-dehydrogenase gamma chain